jgi:hypothetical protein
VPILAKQAIEGTSLVENGEVFVAIFRAITISKLGITSSCPTRTNPISHTVSRQGVMIPTDIGFICCSAFEFIPLIIAKSTIASAIGGQAAFIYTNTALWSCFIVRRMNREIKLAPGFVMGFLYVRQHGSKVLPNAVKAYT